MNTGPDGQPREAQAVGAARVRNTAQQEPWEILGHVEGKKEKGYSKVQYTSIYIFVATETLLFWGKHLWTKPVTLELMCGWAHRATRANTFKQHNAKCKLLLSRMTLEKKSRDYRPGHHLREFSLGVAKFNFIVFREKK